MTAEKLLEGRRRLEALQTSRAIAVRRVLVLLVGAAMMAQPAEAVSLMRLIATIPLPGVAGRIDHLALDSTHHRLFVAALGNDSVEVIDLARNRRVDRVEGLGEPQGVLFLSERQKLYVTIGGASGVAVVSGSDLTNVGRIETREDPDNIRYEAAADRVWIGAGARQQAVLAAFGSNDSKVLFEIALDDHPESFQLEEKQPRVFVNVPGQQEVEVVDRERRSVVTSWKLPCAANFPMALDEEHERLFVGCRRPARILGLDTETGRLVAQVESPADADDIFIDQAAGRIYVSSGEGVVRTYIRREADRLEVAGDVSTGRGARTSLLDAGSHRFYVAVPSRGTSPAEIQVFDTSQ